MLQMHFIQIASVFKDLCVTICMQYSKQSPTVECLIKICMFSTNALKVNDMYFFETAIFNLD